MFKRAKTTCAALFATLLLAACGGGGGGTTENGDGGSGQLQAPNLAFSGTPPKTLEIGKSHDFAVTRKGTGKLTWKVTAPDNSATNLVSINATSGRVTANDVGTVKITVTVAATATHSADTTGISHTLTITLQNPNLAFSGTPPTTLEVNDPHDFDATSAPGTTITWSVTNPNDSATNRATIIPETGVLTADAVGQVKITATVAETATHSAATISHTLDITRREAKLILSTFSTDIPVSGGDITLTATTDSDAPITWSGTNNTVATVTANNDGTATLTPLAAGTLTVTAAVAQTPTYKADSKTSGTVTINTLQSPNLMITGSPPAILEPTQTHTFTATTAGNTPITWSVNNPDGSATVRATITPAGVLTASVSGSVEVIATVAGDDTYSGATASHRLTILAPANLTLTSTVDTLEPGDTHTFTATTAGNTDITWSVTNPNDSATDRATIDPASGVLTAVSAGPVKVTATVAADNTHSGDTASHTLTILAAPNLAFTTPVATLEAGLTHNFSATSDSSGTLTYSVTATDGSSTDLATINPNRGVLTANKIGAVKVIATLAEGAAHSAATVSHDLTITLRSSTFSITAAPTGNTLAVNEVFDFEATTNNPEGVITWSVTDLSDASTDLATIDPDSGVLTAVKAGRVKVTATLAADESYRGASLNRRITLTRLPANLTLGAYSTSITRRGDPVTLTATTDSDASITWSITDTNGDPTTFATLMGDGATAILTPSAVGVVRVTAAVAESDTHEADSVTTDDITINDLEPANLMITGTPPATLEVDATYDFEATSADGTTIAWSVTNSDGSDSVRATIVPETGVLTATGGGPVEVTATVTESATHSGATQSHTIEITRFANTITFTTTIDTLEARETHDFAATSNNTGGTITYSVTQPDGTATDLAGIDTAGLLTAVAAGRVRVTATVEEDSRYRRATTSHDLTITRTAATLTLSAKTDTLAVAGMYDFNADSSDAMDARSLAWSVTNPDDSPTDRATIDPSSGVLTAVKVGRVKVTATAAEDGTYSGASVSHTVQITRLPANLAFGAFSTEITQRAGAVTLTATTDSDASITWSLTDTNGDPTTLATLAATGATATLTPNALGTVRVAIAVVQTDTHEAGDATTDITINDLLSSRLSFTDTVGALLADDTYAFMASTAGNTPITWSVTALDGTATTLATIDGSGLLTTVAAGSVLVVATVAADDTYNTATISHEVEISLRSAGLTFTSSPAHLLINHTTRFTAAWSGGGSDHLEHRREQPGGHDQWERRWERPGHGGCHGGDDHDTGDGGRYPRLHRRDPDRHAGGDHRCGRR